MGRIEAILGRIGSTLGRLGSILGQIEVSCGHVRRPGRVLARAYKCSRGGKIMIQEVVGLTEHNTKQQDASEMKMSTWCTWSEVTWQGLENINK